MNFCSRISFHNDNYFNYYNYSMHFCVKKQKKLLTAESIQFESEIFDRYDYNMMTKCALQSILIQIESIKIPGKTKRILKDKSHQMHKWYVVGSKKPQHYKYVWLNEYITITLKLKSISLKPVKLFILFYVKRFHKIVAKSTISIEISCDV